MQGDVTNLMDAEGSVLVTYTYDPWGKPLSIDDSTPEKIGNINPLRYRGYYYDAETGFYYLGSRYYDPEIGRFINADTVTDGGAGVLGNNLFLYAANNPINNSDPSGQWIIKNAIKWLAKNVYKPAVKKVKKALSKVNVTCTKGISTTFSPGMWSFNMQGGVSIDTKGNVAFQGTFAGGATTNGSLGLSFGKFSMVTNAPKVDNLNGPGYQLGGSANVPAPPLPISISVGGEFNVIPDLEKNTNYYGLTTFSGVALPTPITQFEGHAEWGETGTAFQFNVFGVMENVYIRIMEW